MKKESKYSGAWRGMAGRGRAGLGLAGQGKGFKFKEV